MVKSVFFKIFYSSKTFDDFYFLSCVDPILEQKSANFSHSNKKEASRNRKKSATSRKWRSMQKQNFTKVHWVVVFFSPHFHPLFSHSCRRLCLWYDSNWRLSHSDKFQKLSVQLHSLRSWKTKPKTIQVFRILSFSFQFSFYIPTECICFMKNLQCIFFHSFVCLF